MIEGSPHNKPDEECPYSWLNEWLCEYVDGTMDPSLRNNFEEYLAANPELAEHVECLQRTRELLCQQARNSSAPFVLRRRMSQREADQEDAEVDDSNGWRSEYGRGGGMITMFVVGMAFSAVLLSGDIEERVSTAIPVSSEGEQMVEDAPPSVHQSPAELTFIPISPRALNAGDGWVMEPTGTVPLGSSDSEHLPVMLDTTISPAMHLSER